MGTHGKRATLIMRLSTLAWEGPKEKYHLDPPKEWREAGPVHSLFFWLVFNHGQTIGTLLSLESWGKWLYHFTTLLLFRVIQGSSNISVPHAQSVHPHWRPTETSSSTGATLRNRCSRVRILKASRHKGTEGGTVPGVPLGVQVGASTGRQEGCDCRLLVP